MYSAVLMLALTAGGDAVDHGRSSCHGCTVCTTTVVSCTSACSSACNTRHGLFNRCHGCSSSCTSCTVVSNCCGTSHGCNSCRGGLFHRRNNCNGCNGCNGCTVCTVCSSGCVVVPATPAKEMVPAPKKTGATSAPATIVVSLPADARLVVDGAQTSSTSDRRTLVTPELQFGETYTYTMQAEVVRDGRTVAQTQQVSVRGGEVSTVNFNFSTQTVASR